MTLETQPAQDEEAGLLRLSHRLVALQIGGIALLILIVLATAIWISAEHNRLALASSERLVENELASLRTRTYTLVKDYSIWNEGYEAIVTDDREWLYSSIGSSVTEIGTFDLAVLSVPGGGPAFGWVKGSPVEGETGLLDPELFDALEALLQHPGGSSAATRTLIAERGGAPWIFAISRMTRVDGTPNHLDGDVLPRQIHGQELTQDRLNRMSRDLLTEGITLSDHVAPGQASVPLVDYHGDVIGHVVWQAPRPGASILRQVAAPLALALAVATVISALSSLYAVRSARRLERALLAAKAADRSRTEFLSNVSHELRTPMNGVLGAAQLLETTELDGEQRELVGVLLSSSKAQMSLISDLIDLSRMDAGRRQLASEPFEPAAIVTEVADMMAVAAGKKRIRLDTDLAAISGLTVRGDAQAFRQIITNLVGNAVKFTDEGGVTLRTALSASGDRTRIAVSVVDTGVGIPEAALPRIFERFYQVDGSMSRRSEGTGLGLAISQKLAQSMGGEIAVASRLGTGSTFTFAAIFEPVPAVVRAEERNAA